MRSRLRAPQSTTDTRFYRPMHGHVNDRIRARADQSVAQFMLPQRSMGKQICRSHEGPGAARGPGRH